MDSFPNHKKCLGSKTFKPLAKIGVWAKTKIDHNDKIGNIIAENFIKKEVERENRRKEPRTPLK